MYNLLEKLNAQFVFETGGLYPGCEKQHILLVFLPHELLSSCGIFMSARKKALENKAKEEDGANVGMDHWYF